MWKQSGPITEVTQTMLKYEMDMTRGQSGAPLFVTVNNQHWGIGINVRDAAPNAAVRITPAVHQWLKSQVR